MSLRGVLVDPSLPQVYMMSRKLGCPDQILISDIGPVKGPFLKGPKKRVSDYIFLTYF